MEAEAAAVAAIVGTVVSTWLLWDAWIDRRVHHRYQHIRHPIVNKLIFDRMIGETVRFIVQVLFLVVALVFVFDRSAFFDAAVWLLVAVPVLLAIWSTYSWLRRLQLLFGEDDEAASPARHGS